MNRKHYMANDYKILCEEADKISRANGRIKESSNGYQVLETYHDKGSNFKGVLYYRNGEYAIAFAGTDKWSAKDHGANLKMAVSGNSRQIKDAQKFTKDMKVKYGLDNTNTVSLGHSEGGTEATLVGINNGFPTVTFNAYGVGAKMDEKNAYNDLVINYRDPHDPVSKLKENVGETFIVPDGKYSGANPLGAIKAHGIGNMGDCGNAIPVKDYKKENRFFIDKISDADISRKDIGSMSTDLYRVYEKEIDKRMESGRIKSSGSNGGDEGNWVTINGNHVLIKS